MADFNLAFISPSKNERFQPRGLRNQKKVKNPTFGKTYENLIFFSFSHFFDFGARGVEIAYFFKAKLAPSRGPPKTKIRITPGLGDPNSLPTGDPTARPRRSKGKARAIQRAGPGQPNFQTSGSRRPAQAIQRASPGDPNARPRRNAIFLNFISKSPEACNH